MKRKLAGLLIAVMATGVVSTVVLADEGTYVPTEYVEFNPFKCTGWNGNGCKNPPFLPPAWSGGGIGQPPIGTLN